MSIVLCYDLSANYELVELFFHHTIGQKTVFVFITVLKSSKGCTRALYKISRMVKDGGCVENSF